MESSKNYLKNERKLEQKAALSDFSSYTVSNNSNIDCSMANLTSRNRLNQNLSKFFEKNFNSSNNEPLKQESSGNLNFLYDETADLNPNPELNVQSNRESLGEISFKEAYVPNTSDSKVDDKQRVLFGEVNLTNKRLSNVNASSFEAILSSNDQVKILNSLNKLNSKYEPKKSLIEEEINQYNPLNKLKKTSSNVTNISVEPTDKLRKRSESTTGSMSSNSTRLSSKNHLILKIVYCLRNYNYKRELEFTQKNLEKKNFMQILKEYNLGPNDKLKCNLCCISNINLNETLFQMRNSNTNLNSNFDPNNLNCDNIEDLILKINSFNPFGTENCKQEYAQCSGDNLETMSLTSSNISSLNELKKKYEKYTSKTQNTSMMEEKQNLKKTLKTNKRGNQESIYGEELIADQKLKNNKITNKNMGLNRKSSGYEFVKFKSVPVCKDHNGNLILSINIPEKIQE